MKKFPILMVLIFGLILCGCVKTVQLKPVSPVTNPVVDVKGDAGAPLLAGFAREAVTPKGSVLMAGFGLLRFSRGVHDDLYVRALVLKQGKEKLALVAVDALGIQRTDIMNMKQGVAGFRPDQILIASTHTHSGPDTLGLWGFPPIISGRNDKFMDAVTRAVAHTIQEAEQAAVSVNAFTAAYQADPTIMVNDRTGEPEDHAMGLMVFKNEKAAIVATLINATGHAETMWDKNHILTSDYPGRVCVLTEKEFGGGAIFFNGDLGAMMTPAHPGPGQKPDFARLERVSQAVFGDVKRGMILLEEEKAPVISHKMSMFYFPMQNKTFDMLMKTGLLTRDAYEDKQGLTETNLIEIGSAQIVTIPGEAYPKLGLQIRAKQKPHSFIFGLADDELGYIIFPRDYGTELYEYETTMCAGPELSVMLQKTVEEMLGK